MWGPARSHREGEKSWGIGDVFGDFGDLDIGFVEMGKYFGLVLLKVLIGNTAFDRNNGLKVG